MAREPQPGAAEKVPQAIDVHVGSRVRLRRTLLGMTQEKLGERLGVTFQQVQKYERGTNRIGASRLFDLFRILDVPVGFFFDDLPEAKRNPAPSPGPQQGSDQAQPSQGDDDLMHRRETLEVVRAYYRITDPIVRRRVFDLIKTLAPAGEE